MKFEVKDLSKQHPIVMASSLMACAYHRHETMIPACEEVAEEFPELTGEQIMCLWIGVNSAENSSKQKP